MFNFIEIKEQIIEKMFYELLPLEEFFSLSTIHIDKNILFLYFRLFFWKRVWLCCSVWLWTFSTLTLNSQVVGIISMYHCTQMANKYFEIFVAVCTAHVFYAIILYASLYVCVCACVSMCIHVCFIHLLANRSLHTFRVPQIDFF
jgi:hypothetical protein